MLPSYSVRSPLSVLLASFSIILSFAFTSALPSPDTLACCRKGLVDETCATLLCRADHPPGHMEVFSADFKRCSRHLTVVASCLADGRNHLGCCQAEAERPESACFDLCQGSAPGTALNTSHIDDSSYTSYMSCLAFNINTIYMCFRKGYSVAPTPPRHLVTSSIEQHSASLTWDAPAKYGDIVDQFHLYYKEHLPGRTQAFSPPALVTMSKVSTSDTSHTIQGLSPNTRYSVYAVSATENEEQLSLPSKPATFVTPGLPPKIQAYPSQIVRASRAANQILVCKININGLERPILQIGWSKKVGDGFEPLTHSSLESDEVLPKYSQTAYQSKLHLEGHSRTIITTLTIRAAGMEDYGTYLCSVDNLFGSVDSQLTLSPPRRIQVPSSPKLRSNCGGELGIGGGSAPDANDYLASRTPSILDIMGLLSCAVKGRHNAGCCLRGRVPERCLGLCDEKLGSDGSFQLFTCLSFSTAIFHCDMEAKAFLPTAPRGLRVVRAGPDLRLSWDPVPDALRYHLYYSVEGSGLWSLSSVTEAELRLSGRASQRLRVVVVAESRSGLSGPSHEVSWPQARVTVAPRPLSSGSPQKLRLVAGKLPGSQGV